MGIDMEPEIIHVEDIEHARLFLLFYIFEAWEKLLQIRAFVNSPEHRRKVRRRAVIRNFNTALESMAQELSDSAVPYYLELETKKNFDLDNFVNVVKFVQDVIEALLQFHKKLDTLAGEGKAESQITYDFVRKLSADTASTPDKSWLPYVPSIALTGDYNFTEHGLLRMLSTILEDSGLEPLPPQGHDIVLTLPKAESENPLMWAILAHETAHIMISQYRILDEILGRTSEIYEVDLLKSRKYESWIEEICADLIALRLLGPSYYFSFASMAILLDPQGSEFTHPAPVHRLGIMESIIRKHYPEWIVDCPSQQEPFVQKSLVPLFLDLVVYKETLWSAEKCKNKLKNRSFEEIPPESIIVDKDLVFDVLDHVHVPTARFSEQEQLNGIFETLLTGQPVSSWKKRGFDKDRFVKDLGKARTADEIYATLPPPEEPLALSTIISSGWMLKIYHDYTGLLSNVRQVGSLYGTLESYSETIRRRSLVLQTSLNRAFMMQMYWQWKEEVE